MPVIFHLARRPEWDEAVASGDYRRSTRDQSLDDVGFIHCSTAAQVGPTAQCFYADEPADLVLLTIDVDRLDADVVYEGADGATELFPHIYGPLPVVAVTSVEPLARDTAGVLVLPADLAERG